MWTVIRQFNFHSNLRSLLGVLSMYPAPLSPFVHHETQNVKGNTREELRLLSFSPFSNLVFTIFRILQSTYNLFLYFLPCLIQSTIHSSMESLENTHPPTTLFHLYNIQKIQNPKAQEIQYTSVNIYETFLVLLKWFLL